MKIISSLKTEEEIIEIHMDKIDNFGQNLILEYIKIIRMKIKNDFIS